MFVSPFSISITSFGEERASLGAFRTVVRSAFVSCCLFPLPLGVWQELQFVIVAFPGLYSYPFFITKKDTRTDFVICYYQDLAALRVTCYHTSFHFLNA